MFIRLSREWSSYRKGSVVEVSDAEALELLISKKAVRAKKGNHMKNLGSPPHDKMMRKADRQK